MNKLIKSEHISKVMLGGDPAGEFNPETLVYGEYAVRIMIYNALNHFTDRHLTNTMPSNDEGQCPECEHRFLHHPECKKSRCVFVDRHE